MKAAEIATLRSKIAEQRRWIESCGGSIGGYILNYGSASHPENMSGDGGEAIYAADTKELTELIERLERAMK